MRGRRFNPDMADPRARDTAHIRMSEQRKKMIEARLEQGLEGFCEWCEAQNVLAWSLTDQSMLLGLVLAKHGQAVRDMVRDSVL